MSVKVTKKGKREEKERERKRKKEKGKKRKIKEIIKQLFGEFFEV